MWGSVKDFNRGKSDEDFFYSICNDCGSIFLDPVPANLEEFYDSDYGPYASESFQEKEAVFSRCEDSKLEIVRRYVPVGKLVEIGPAKGRFLSVAKRAGYDIFGIERDLGCVKHIKDGLGLNVRCSDKPEDELSFLAGNCDVIVAWHVIEHLRDLVGFVRAASMALRSPVGRLIVSSPNPEALSFKVFGRYWAHLDAPRHLTLIPLSALDRLMAAHGLERVAYFSDDPVGLLQNRTGWQGSLANLFRLKKIHPLLLAKVLGRIMAVGMSLVERIQGQGASYTVVYKHKVDKIEKKRDASFPQKSH
jgi:hypothetical protein